MKVTHLACALALACLGGACEKQSYSETRAFTHHGSHGGGEHKGEAKGQHENGEKKANLTSPASPDSSESPKPATP